MANRRRRLIGIALAALVVASVPRWAPAIETITYCGQAFRGRGILAGNLDCTGFIGPGVVIEAGKLFLNGFTISGAGYFGVQCLTSCQIIGPGTITGSGMDGVYVGKWVILRDVRVTNNTINGVFARNNSERARVILKDSVVSGNGVSGVETDVAVVTLRSTITNNGEHGIDVGTRDCTSAGRIVMFASTAFANAVNCDFSPACGDLTSCNIRHTAPRLYADSTCGVSYVRNSGSPGESWGVCGGR